MECASVVGIHAVDVADSYTARFGLLDASEGLHALATARGVLVDYGGGYDDVTVHFVETSRGEMVVYVFVDELADSSDDWSESHLQAQGSSSNSAIASMR